jgi:predicted DNA-binding transcriptional regulator AlpA
VIECADLRTQSLRELLKFGTIFPSYETSGLQGMNEELRTADDRLLTAPEVMRRYNITSRQTIYNWIGSNIGFPEPTKLCGKSYFSLNKLRAFESKFQNKFGAMEVA